MLWHPVGSFGQAYVILCLKTFSLMSFFFFLKIVPLFYLSLNFQTYDTYFQFRKLFTKASSGQLAVVGKEVIDIAVCSIPNPENLLCRFMVAASEVGWNTITDSTYREHFVFNAGLQGISRVISQYIFSNLLSCKNGCRSVYCAGACHRLRIIL
jgi:hypothetical protein